jgi:hypothetical protein
VQLNTLNRVIALFLIGGLVIVVAAVALEKQIRPILEQYSKMDLGPSAGVFLAVALLSLTALAGTFIDALGNITARRFIRKLLARRRFMAGLFLCADEFDAQDRWRMTFKGALDNDPRFKALAQRDDMIKALSAGFFFRTAEKEHAEWLVQHHSMYHLSANFIIILIACVVWSFRAGLAYVAFGCVLAAYLLTSFALDNYLYTYQLSFRNAYLALTDVRDAKPGEGGAAQGTKS